MSRALLLIVLAACHASGGPVLAYSPAGSFRLGVEASGGLGPLRGAIGRTMAPFASAPARRYITFEPGYLEPLQDPGYSRPMTFAEHTWTGGGLSFGYASGDDGESGAVLGMWGAGVYQKECTDGHNGLNASIAIGVRLLADVFEVYATPKIGVDTCPALGD